MKKKYRFVVYMNGRVRIQWKTFLLWADFQINADGSGGWNHRKGLQTWATIDEAREQLVRHLDWKDRERDAIKEAKLTWTQSNTVPIDVVVRPEVEA